MRFFFFCKYILCSLVHRQTKPCRQLGTAVHEHWEESSWPTCLLESLQTQINCSGLLLTLQRHKLRLIQFHVLNQFIVLCIVLKYTFSSNKKTFNGGTWWVRGLILFTWYPVGANICRLANKVHKSGFHCGTSTWETCPGLWLVLSVPVGCVFTGTGLPSKRGWAPTLATGMHKPVNSSASPKPG